MRRFLVALATVVLVLPFAMTALAGGAVWEFEGYHRPGDRVESTTAVAWSHDSDLGTPEDGPFFVYLMPERVTTESWPEVASDGLLVGVVEIQLGPTRAPHHAIARFEIPDVPAGSYQIVHCNDPCTATLGDIVGGWDLRVLSGDEGRSAAAIAAEVQSLAPSLPLLFDAEHEPVLVKESSRTTSICLTALLGGEVVVV